MPSSAQIARQFRQVIFGGNWTAVDFKATLADVTWEEALARRGELNTIAILVGHCHYYVRNVTKVLEGGPLEGKDALSFTHPPIQNTADWQAMLAAFYEESERFAQLVEAIPDTRWTEIFEQEKYGDYYRNIGGIIEHHHYHLGQIVWLKKWLRTSV